MPDPGNEIVLFLALGSKFLNRAKTSNSDRFFVKKKKKDTENPYTNLTYNNVNKCQ